MLITVMKTTAIVHVHNNGLLEGAESDETDKSVVGCIAAFSSFKDAINAETSNHNLMGEGSGKYETPQSPEDKYGINNNENVTTDDVPELTTISIIKVSIPEALAITQPVNLLPIEEEPEELNCVDNITIQNEAVAEISAEEESSTSIRKVVISKRVSILKAKESSSGDIGTKNNNQKPSYPEMISKRKNLIKIHRITDS